MNYDEPRRRQSDGRWDMTSRNDDRIRPIGYCVPRDRADPRTWSFTWVPDDIRRDHTTEGPTLRDEARAREVARFDEHAEKYHGDGHATQEEASDCYRAYVLDQRVAVMERSNEYVRCQGYEGEDLDPHVGVCDATGPALTRGAVMLEGWHKWDLCPGHQNRETYERLWPGGKVYTSVHS